MTALDVRGDFGLPEDRIWLNTAHQGALPMVSATAARRAIEWKLQPYQMTTDRFGQVPRELKESLGRLIDVPADDVILANGASYGLHLLANGLPLQKDDEVVLMEGDFPSNLLPWRAATERGVNIKVLKPADQVLTPDEMKAVLSPRTRLVLLSWVHSFSGRALDVTGIGKLCRDNGTWLAVNASQALGVRPIQVRNFPVDALISAGWKWLCGPYGTGFTWMRRSLRSTLQYNQAYWLAAQNEKSLRSATQEFTVPPASEARRYDIFATANFFNFLPWKVSIDYLLDVGPDRIAAHVGGLVEKFMEGLDTSRFDLVSSTEKQSRSSLVLFTHKDTERHEAIHAALTDAGIDVALRKGRLRISPHLYNVPADIDRVLEVLHEAG